MPYSKQERARLAAARKKKEEAPVQRDCFVCRTNTVLLAKHQIPRPCEPCWWHLKYDTGFTVAKCHYCGQPAFRDYITAIWTRYPYCGSCQRGDGLGSPESPLAQAWALWPWHEAQEAHRADRAALVASPFALLIRPPHTLFGAGWRADIHVRTNDPFESAQVLEKLELPDDGNHWDFWPQVVSWLRERD